MANLNSTSILDDIYASKFFDRYNPNITSYDVIIPILNTNNLFEKNLNSLYSKISINRLIIGDAGSTDSSLDVLKKFPRVEVINHKNYETSGICIADLIKKVQTEFFFYIHSDVFISSEDCVNALVSQQRNAEWIEGFRHHLAIVSSIPDNYYTDERSYSGMQFGRADFMKNAVARINDGELQRNEDIVIAELVKNQGGRFLKVKEFPHIHQIMNKDGSHEPPIRDLKVFREENKKWSINNWKIQIIGIVLHTSPKKYLVKEVQLSILNLLFYGALDLRFLRQLAQQNPRWGKFIYERIPLSLIFAFCMTNPRRAYKAKLSIIKLIISPKLL